MQCDLGTPTRPTGCGHIHLPVTVNGLTRNVVFTAAQLREGGPETLAEAEERLLSRLRSVLLEAGATTFAEVKAALEGVTVHI